MHDLPAADSSRLVGVLGRPKTGKSTLLRAIVRQHVELGDHRFVIWDQLSEWTAFHKNVLVIPSWRASLEEAAERALRWAPCTLVVDEAERELPNRGGVSDLPGVFVPTVVYRGRHFRVALLWATQRPGRAHQSLVALATTLFAFQLTHSRDLARIADEVSPEAAVAVGGLQPRQYLRFDLG